MDIRLDEVDRRIIYALMEDARNTSAPMIAEELDVSAGTVRNRIERLEEEGIIQGYHASVNFERAGGRLMSLYMCTVPAADRERLALAARSISGVVNVRVLMAGRRDLHVVAVGNDTEDLRDIARSLSELEIRIEDEELLQTEIRSPYAPFGPAAEGVDSDATEVVTLADGAEVVEVTVEPGAPLAGQSVGAARGGSHLPAEVGVISVERDGDILQPTEETVFEPGDVVAFHVEESSVEEPLSGFSADAENEAEAEE